MKPPRNLRCPRRSARGRDPSGGDGVLGLGHALVDVVGVGVQVDLFSCETDRDQRQRLNDRVEIEPEPGLQLSVAQRAGEEGQRGVGGALRGSRPR